MVKLQRTSLIIVSLLVSTAAQASDTSDPIEAKQAPLVLKDIALPYLLEDSPYISCEGEGCISGFRPVWSNRSPAAIAALRKKMRPEMRIVKQQWEEMDTIDRLTGEALTMADSLVQQGAGAKLLELTIYLPERPFRFSSIATVSALGSTRELSGHSEGTQNTTSRGSGGGSAGHYRPRR